FGRCGVRVVEGVEKNAWRDLPGEAPPVLAPAAGALLAAVVDERVPVAVGLGLILGDHDEADRFVRPEVGASVEADELLAEHAELDRQLVPFFAAGKVRRRAVRGADMTVGKDRGVELRCVASLAVVEPKARDHRVGCHSGLLFVDDADRAALVGLHPSLRCSDQPASRNSSLTTRPVEKALITRAFSLAGL